MEPSDERIKKIVSAIQKLKSEHQAMQQLIPKLENRIRELEEALALEKNIGNPEKITKIAALFTPKEQKDMIRQLQGMIREIDSGISLLELQLSDENK